MFPTSSQKKYWIFADERDLMHLREKTNATFIEKYGAGMTVSNVFNDKILYFSCYQLLIWQHNNYTIFIWQPEQREQFFLTNLEERTLLRFYELQLRDFCKRFMPVMPKATVATALQYFKRFYLRNSVMDYHPKEILVTCVYLACKVSCNTFLTFRIKIYTVKIAFFSV